MTRLRVQFAQIDPNAKPNISETAASSVASWAHLPDLGQDNISPPLNVATLEPNGTVLGGDVSEFPDDSGVHTWGFFSGIMSNEIGEFSEPLSLSFAFSAPIAAPGITLYNYPHTPEFISTVNVSWFSDEAGTQLISQGQYELVGVVAQISEVVNGYRRVKIDFLGTNLPYRFAKIWAIEFGKVREMDDDEVSECRVLEEIDPTSRTISINTLSARIRTRESIFSPITSPEFDETMMDGQLLKIFRNDQHFGTFFLRGWDDVYQDGIVFDFDAEDAISVLDRHEIMGGMYINKPVSELLDEIFEICFPTGIINYVLDTEYHASVISGYLPICSCGEALQHIAFALHATVDTARIGHVWIYGREYDVKSDGVPTANDEMGIAPAYNLRTHQSPYFFPSLESNYTLLDGLLEELPNTIDGHLGWISESMSDDSGEFSNPPTITINFATTHNFSGATLVSSPYAYEHVKEMRATFYDESGAQISQEVHTFEQSPARWVQDVRGYRRIKIEVLKTSVPNRFARIGFIDYGKSFFIPRVKQYSAGGIDKSKPFISKVSVISHRYSPIVEDVQAFRGVLPLGRNEIRFTEPLHSVSVSSSATIVVSHVNYVVLNVTSETVEITVTGRAFDHSLLTHVVKAPPRAGSVGITESVEGYTLVSPDRGDYLAGRLLAYYQSRVHIERDCVLDDLEVGYIAELETRGNSVVGVISSMTCDLRANRTQLEIVGDVVRRER
ncbi:MAG: hypothetical protein FWC66_05155 [Oscillospiraceae bacterium]|nr:hypothetical protein [Oscillospiraceae bacterium]